MRPHARIVLAGALVGMPGGLIGLGGAEFRLPLLIGIFSFAALDAVILNKATSLVVVAAALPFRAGTVPLEEVLAHWPVILNLCAGSLAGAWLGAGLAVRMRSRRLDQVLAGLLVVIAGVLAASHGVALSPTSLLSGWPQVAAGLLDGLGIGLVASLMGVAIGGLLLRVVPEAVLLPVPVTILLVSAVKVRMLVGMTATSPQSRALAALGHEASIAIFRLLVKAGDDGLRVDDIGQHLGSRRFWRWACASRR